MNQNYINHIALVLDASQSMGHIAREVVQVADNQIKHLATRSKELDQETRVTVYVFDYADNIRCIFYDKDVLRMPSLQGHYRPTGYTALVDATMKSIEDLAKTPELYGDHAFLVYVLTDGAENASRKYNATQLTEKIKGLKENWTIAAFVPNQQCKFEAKKFGFPADNIAVWDTTAQGIAEVGEILRTTTDAYMTSRSLGVRGSKNLFNMPTNLAKTDVSKKLSKLHAGQYRMAKVEAVEPIAPFVEKLTKRSYRLGEAYYQLSKPEKVQPGKAVALFEKKTHSVYVGAEARQLLGLPDHEVKVAPAAYPDFEIFVQSGSVNRKLVPDTRLLLLS